MSSLFSIGLPAVLATAVPLPQAEREAVEEAVGHYFRSGDENDASELEIAFHPTLGMYWVGKDGVYGKRRKMPGVADGKKSKVADHDIELDYSKYLYYLTGNPLIVARKERQVGGSKRKTTKGGGAKKAAPKKPAAKKAAPKKAAAKKGAAKKKPAKKKGR